MKALVDLSNKKNAIESDDDVIVIQRCIEYFGHYLLCSCILMLGLCTYMTNGGFPYAVYCHSALFSMRILSYLLPGDENCKLSTVIIISDNLTSMILLVSLGYKSIQFLKITGYMT